MRSIESIAKEMYETFTASLRPLLSRQKWADLDQETQQAWMAAALVAVEQANLCV